MTNNERETNATRSITPELPAAHTAAAALGHYLLCVTHVGTGKHSSCRIFRTLYLYTPTATFTLNPRQIKCPDTIKIKRAHFDGLDLLYKKPTNKSDSVS